MVALPLQSLAIVGGVCAAIAFIAYRKDLLDGPGIAAAVFVGAVIGLLGDPSWLVALLVYMVSSFAATKLRFQKKLEMGVAEGRRGERTWRNVFANGLPPTAVAALAGLAPEVFSPGTSGFVFLTAISVAAADTLASEIGVLSPSAVLITRPLRRVRPGTDGGVSLLGQAAALAASTYVALIGYAVFAFFAPATLRADPLLTAVPIFFGFLGCQIDSIMGATIERKGVFDKHGVNFWSITLTTIAAWGFLRAGVPA